MKFHRIASLGLPAFAACLLSAGVAVADADMPSVVVPDDDMSSESQADVAQKPADDPSEYLLNMIRGQLSTRYADPDVSADESRIDALLSGDYINDYASQDNAVQFSNTVFDVSSVATPAPQPEPAPAPDSSGEPARAKPSDMLLTPAAIRAMSAMSPDQIEAIALLVELMENPEKANVTPQMALRGIPSLSAEDLASQTPEELLTAMIAPQETQPAVPPVVDLGDGRDLTIGQWETILSPDGRVEISNPTIPGSRFDVEIGAVVGQFGRVTNISVTPGDLYVEFETGDRISGKSVSLEDGIPSLDENGEAVEPLDGEILVSGAAPQSTEILVSEAATPRAEKPVRPRPRPENLMARHEVDEPTPDNVAAASDDVAPATTPARALYVRPLPRPEHPGASVAGPDEIADQPVADVAEMELAALGRIRPKPRPDHITLKLPDDPVIPQDQPAFEPLRQPGKASPLAPKTSDFPQPHPRRHI